MQSLHLKDKVIRFWCIFLCQLFVFSTLLMLFWSCSCLHGINAFWQCFFTRLSASSVEWFSQEGPNSVILWNGEDLKSFIKGNATNVSETSFNMNLFDHFRDYQLIWDKLCRYASLYFCMCIDQDDNELEILEIIHHFVEILDRYFGSVSELKLDLLWEYYWHHYISSDSELIYIQVCELDLIFNFHKVHLLCLWCTCG